MAEQTLKDIGPVVLVGAGKMGLAMARGWIAGGLPAYEVWRQAIAGAFVTAGKV